MVKSMNTNGIEKATGKSFEWWCKALDKAGAKDMSHTEIAKFVPQLAATSGWWAQGITVSYEQHLGRRKPGQRADGTFSASVSLTVAGTPNDNLALWQKSAEKVLPKSLVLVSQSASKPGARYLSWRGKFKSGSTAVIGFDAKAANKCLVAVEHQKLASPELLDSIKKQWRAALTKVFG
jgi:hypothetical protein